jgi:hypothetical protein
MFECLDSLLPGFERPNFVFLNSCTIGNNNYSLLDDQIFDISVPELDEGNANVRPEVHRQGQGLRS